MSPDSNARVRVATLLRELGHDYVARDVSDEVLDDVAQRIQQVVDLISAAPGRTRERTIGNFESFRQGLPQHGRDEPRHLFADSIVSGGANPMGLGAYLWRDGDQAVMEVTLGRAFEGAPERAHGGIVAALLDETMGMVNSIHGMLGLTATLNISYLAATPVGVPLVTRAWLESREGRKITIRATVSANDEVVVEANALFIAIDLEKFHARS
jgi:acyl-coenzyme A thioesterase PaaI-like protein